MYVGKRYEQQVVSSDHRTFTCVHCKHEQPALVIGVGTGSGLSPFGLDNSGARDEAMHSATRGASSNINTAIECAGCPKCGKHDRRARLKVYLWSSLVPIALGALIAVLIIAAANGAAYAWKLGIDLGALTAIGLTVFRARSKFTGVIFENAETSAPAAFGSSMLRGRR